jgi:hypothetical protein
MLAPFGENVHIFVGAWNPTSTGQNAKEILELVAGLRLRNGGILRRFQSNYI